MTAITFEQFCSDELLLGPWFTGPQRSADSRVGTPQLAAARAIHSATIDFANASSGTVLVLVPAAAEQRQTVQYLHAFLEQPALARYVARTLPDGVELRSGLVIEVSANDKRLVRDVLSTIELRPEERLTELPDHRDLARTILHVWGGDPDWESRVEKLANVEAGTLAALREQVRAERAEMVARLAEMEARAWEAKAPPMPVAPPNVVDGHYTPEWEELDAMRRMGAPELHSPRVIRFPPGGRR
jgi:hypothetical protein